MNTKVITPQRVLRAPDEKGLPGFWGQDLSAEHITRAIKLHQNTFTGGFVPNTGHLPCSLGRNKLYKA